MNRKFAVSIIGILILGFQPSAQAENEQSAPLVFTYSAKGPGIVDSPVTVTSGAITSIGCSWESEGEVRVEVSANGGGSYAALYNGQIISDGFIPGNRLCFRAKLVTGSILTGVTLGYKDTSGANRMYRNSKWNNFKYKKQVEITGTGEDLFNWPVRIQIKTNLYSEKGITGNFRDIRFAGEDGQRELNYYLEKVNLNDGLPVSADFWVKIPQVPGTGCSLIYAYYGNPVAADGSDGAKVFPFFDDFNGAAVDILKWDVRPGLDKRCDVSGGWLELAECSIVSRSFRIRKGIIEFKAKADKNTAIQAIVRGIASGRSAYPLEQIVYSSAYPGAEHAIAVNDVAKLNAGSPIKPLTEYIYQAVLDQSGIIFERYSPEYEKQAEIRFLNMDSADEGYIGLKAAADLTEKGSAYFDWIRVRPYAGSEPVVALNEKRE